MKPRSKVPLATALLLVGPTLIASSALASLDCEQGQCVTVYAELDGSGECLGFASISTSETQLDASTELMRSTLPDFTSIQERVGYVLEVTGVSSEGIFIKTPASSEPELLLIPDLDSGGYQITERMSGVVDYILPWLDSNSDGLITLEDQDLAESLADLTLRQTGVFTISYDASSCDGATDVATVQARRGDIALLDDLGNRTSVEFPGVGMLPQGTPVGFGALRSGDTLFAHSMNVPAGFFYQFERQNLSVNRNDELVWASTEGAMDLQAILGIMGENPTGVFDTSFSFTLIPHD